MHKTMIKMEYDRDMRHMEYMKHREEQEMKYNKDEDMVNHEVLMEIQVQEWCRRFKES